MLEVALKVLKEIHKYGHEGYLVGGFPRDHYLGRKSSDVDICTSAKVNELLRIFPNAVVKNEEYGSVSLFYQHVLFEITTYRKELQYKNHRILEKTLYVKELRVDLERRDFVMNTLCMDYNGEYVDYLGAISDIEGHLIRMVGDPRIRLYEDVLRILRAVRFATTLSFTLDETLRYYMREYGYLLKGLSYTRKKEELNRIFSSPNVSYGVSLLQELHLDVYLEIKGLENLKVTTSLIGMWAQLDFSSKYSFSKQERKEMEKIRELLRLDILDDMVMYSYGLYYIGMVADMRGISRKEVGRKYALLPIHSRKDIMITSLEICEVLQLKPGSFIKEVYQDLERAILKGDLKNEKEEIINYISSTIQMKKYGI